MQKGSLGHFRATQNSQVRREKTARALAEKFVEIYSRRFPKAVSAFEAGINDALTYMSFPESHPPRSRSSMLIVRIFQEVKRRTRVVEVFPSESSEATLATEIVLRSSEEWTLRRFLTMDTIEGAEKPNPQLLRH